MRLCRWAASTTSSWPLSASPKCNQASSDADSPSPQEQRVAQQTSRAVETHRLGHRRVGHAHPCTLLRAGRTWHHALFPSRRRPVAHQVRREYRRYGTHLTRRTLPSMCVTTATQMARSASSCSSRSTVRRATLITTSGRAVRCDGLRATGSTPLSTLTTESGAVSLLRSDTVSYLSTLATRADGDRPRCAEGSA